MRTTTKRGLGRGASANGNGRAVLPPSFEAPPGSGNGQAPTPRPEFRRYRQPPPPPRTALGLVGRIVLWLLAAVAVVGSGLAAGAYLYFHETVTDLTDATPAVRAAAHQLRVALPGKPVIALAIGYDQRAGIERDSTSRSDTVMLLRADPEKKALSMLSFPRDLLVEVRCPGRTPHVDKINAAYAECRERGVVDTVRGMTGLPINYLITVNFRGFKQIVAKLGGVWMDVDRRYFNDNSSGYDRYAAIDLQPGYQKLNGSDALDFVRYRHFDSDLYRNARQQLFVEALKQAVTTSFSPTSRSVLKIVRVVRDNVAIGAGGRGSVGARALLGYGLLAYNLPPGHVFQTHIDFNCYGADDGASLSVSTDCIRNAVQQFANPDVSAPQRATDAALRRKPRTRKTAAPPPAKTSVVVLNGNGVAGAAADTAYVLGQRGYVVQRSGDAPRRDYFHTVVYYDARGGKPAKAAAAKLATLFGDADVTKATPAIRRLAGDAMVTVVLGQTYHNTIAPAPPDTTPVKEPPRVYENPGATAGLLRPLQRQARFPLMVPTLLERTSVVSTSSPVRLYKVAGRPAVRLTFVTGANEYWGIQQIAWDEAPALAAPNEVVRVGGRRLALYFNGANLHMVVARRGKATYWVVNTLMNRLSNETMIAIAKGLRPLSSVRG